MTLTEFMLARIAEDEAAANAALEVVAPGDGRWWVDGPAEHSGKWWVYATGEKFEHRATAEHIARNDPARMLAQCDAKRRIVEMYAETNWSPYAPSDLEDAMTEVLRALALPYADHPEFREDWRA